MYYISNEVLKKNNDNIINTILLQTEQNLLEDETTSSIENENTNLLEADNNIKKQMLLKEIEENQKKYEQLKTNYDYITKNIGNMLFSAIKSSNSIN